MSLGPLLGVSGKLKTLVDRLLNASNLDNADTTVSSRLSSTDVIKAADYTAPRAANLANIDKSFTALNLMGTSRTEYTSPGTFSVPPGVSIVWVSAIGGGGASGVAQNDYGSDPSGGGGRPGASAMKVPLIVTPGGSEPVTIGAGGAAFTTRTSTPQPSSPGSATYVGAVGARGGNGVVMIYSPGAGPAGASNFGNIPNHRGGGRWMDGVISGTGGYAPTIQAQNGGSYLGFTGGVRSSNLSHPGPGSTVYGGGGSGASWLGNGAPGGQSGSPGHNGSNGTANTGTGGGGGGRGGNNLDGFGGAGGSGYAFIEYF